MTVFIHRTRLNPFSSILGILMMAVMLIGLFYLAKGVFWLLAKLAFFLLAAALVIHYRTVLDFGKWLFDQWRHQPIRALFITLLSALLYPVLFAYLFLRSIFDRKFAHIQDAAQKQFESEYVDFEELETEIHGKKPVDKTAEVVHQDRYRDLFE
jgi:hypothetical protein